ncbi:hypothetical protein AWC29_07290 [Mycobacterium triplex]|uniref:Uncharacterized protein n=1 Tax=Mycobacterium triplex TaxID=47839 RepID=A0ABX3W8V8_9MYCO|nr:hypothetical protein AWC29_07290 [Mycobacterium triplex]
MRVAGHHFALTAGEKFAVTEPGEHIVAVPQRVHAVGPGQRSLTGSLGGRVPLPKSRGCILVGPHDFPRGRAPGPGHRAPPTFPIGGRRETRTNRTTCNFPPLYPQDRPHGTPRAPVSSISRVGAAKDF